MNDDGSVMIAEPLFSPNTKPRAPNPDSYPRSSVDPFRGFRGFRGGRYDCCCFLSRFVVDRPATRGMRWTWPPRASTMS